MNGKNKLQKEKKMINLVESKTLFAEDEYINLGDPGFIEYWDFSKANMSHEARVQAVSAVASVCYGNDSLDPKFKLYDKLARESIGLPSSSFEFVPVLLRNSYGIDKIQKILLLWEKYWIKDIPNCIRYGQFLSIKEKNDYLITNLRALMYDLEKIKQYDNSEMWDPDNEIWYNTKEEEINIIKNNFFVFRIKATIRDFRQHVRHRRAAYQELSRRYTTGQKVPIEFRIKAAVEEKVPGTIAHLEKSKELYERILKEGFKAEDARDVIPVSMYSTIWTSYYPDGLDNYLKLRTKTSSQKEIRMIANSMEEMLQKKENK